MSSIHPLLWMQRAAPRTDGAPRPLVTYHGYSGVVILFMPVLCIPDPASPLFIFACYVSLQKDRGLLLTGVDGCVGTRETEEIMLGKCPDTSPVGTMNQFLMWSDSNKQITVKFIIHFLPRWFFCQGQGRRGKCYVESCYQDNGQLPCVWSPAQAHEETVYEPQHQAASSQTERRGQ